MCSVNCFGKNLSLWHMSLSHLLLYSSTKIHPIVFAAAVQDVATVLMHYSGTIVVNNCL